MAQRLQSGQRGLQRGQQRGCPTQAAQPKEHYPAMSRYDTPRLAAALAAVIIGQAQAAAAQTDPAAAAVLDAAYAAIGGPAWQKLGGYRLQLSVTTGGMSGTVAQQVDLTSGAYREQVKLGAYAQADGFDGTTAWSTDSSGQPRIETGGEARLNAINQAYRNRLAYFLPDRGGARITMDKPVEAGGRSFDVLHVLPNGGRVFTIYVARDTHLIERMTEQQESDLVTTRFADFRKSGGVVLPYVSTVSIGDTKYDQVITLKDVSFGAQDARLFGVPAAPAADFSFAPGTHSTSIAFNLINNHIYLPVTIGAKPARMMFDTGATNILTSETLQDYGVHSEGALPGGGVGETKQDVGFAKLPAISIGGFTLRDQTFATFAMAGLSRVEGVLPAGLVGYEVARRAVVTIDYARQVMTLTDPAHFTPPRDAIAVKFSFNEHLPQVDGSLDGIPGKFDIDTGSRATVDILSPFAAKHNLIEKYRPAAEAITGWGVGGAARGRPTRAGELRLGDVRITQPMIEISTQTKGAFASPYVAGNVGSGLLRRYTLTLDYARQMLYFQPNAEAHGPFVVDRSGLWLMLEPDLQTARVLDVAPGSAAAAAGIAVGDLITGADGVGLTALTLPGLRKRLAQPAGHEVELSLSRQGAARHVTLRLADRV